MSIIGGHVFDEIPIHLLITVILRGAINVKYFILDVI